MGNSAAQEPPAERAPELDPWWAKTDVSDLPSVDRHPAACIPLSDKPLKIGRALDNNIVVPDLSVSRKHAVIRKSPSGRYEIVDLNSYNGTYVNGDRVDRQQITERDIIAIGSATFRLADGAQLPDGELTEYGELREYIDTAGVPFEARELTVWQGGQIRVDDVSFPVEGRKLVGVIGPSGAGKTTLLRALTGTRLADNGTVLYDNRDLYEDYDELRHRIGYVPQKDILHVRLTARMALGYAAELRFASDTTKEDRDGRVAAVIGQLNLTDHADKRVKDLSGGQQKRVNVALELLTRPSLLFLDEPTSGLDPGLHAKLMDQLRDMAHGEGDESDEGATIIVSTHSMDKLEVCDRLLVLVPGGKVAYYGPPDDALTYFGQDRWADVFLAFDEHEDRDWAGEFRQSGEYAHYIRSPMIARPPQGELREQEHDRETSRLRPRRGRVRQLRTLTSRYLRLIEADHLYLAIVVLAPLGLGGLVRLTSWTQGMAGVSNMLAGPEPIVLMLMITACLAGLVSSYKEVGKELDIFDRERAAGLSAAGYLASKVLVLSGIAVYQGAAISMIGLPKSMLPPTGSFLTAAPFVEVILATVLLEIASTCLGLLLSTLVPGAEQATQFVVGITIAEVVLSGGLVSPAQHIVFAQLSWFAPARWGFAALASTVNLNAMSPPPHDALWDHTRDQWLFDMGMMLLWSALYLLITWWLLNRRSPGRRRKAGSRQFWRSVMGR